MKIYLPPELEKIVNDEMKSGHFRTAEEVIAEALQALRARKNRLPPIWEIEPKKKQSAKCSISLRTIVCASETYLSKS